MMTTGAHFIANMPIYQSFDIASQKQAKMVTSYQIGAVIVRTKMENWANFILTSSVTKVTYLFCDTNEKR